MDKQKNWYNSMAIVSAIKAILGAVLIIVAALKPDLILPEESTGLQQQVPIVVAGVFTIYEIVKAIVGRWKATDEIK